MLCLGLRRLWSPARARSGRPAAPAAPAPGTPRAGPTPPPPDAGPRPPHPFAAWRATAPEFGCLAPAGLKSALGSRASSARSQTAASICRSRSPAPATGTRAVMSAAPPLEPVGANTDSAPQSLRLRRVLPESPRPSVWSRIAAERHSLRAPWTVAEASRRRHAGTMLHGPARLLPATAVCWSVTVSHHSSRSAASKRQLRWPLRQRLLMRPQRPALPRRKSAWALEQPALCWGRTHFLRPCGAERPPGQLPRKPRPKRARRALRRRLVRPRQREGLPELPTQ
mmetsp:Transcript_121127/g.353958  ORF Transcript_121127/g.353958 Transcript_121127/m.353958 type:complete len:283 (+) Transcript_121127:213-1061(+)